MAAGSRIGDADAACAGARGAAAWSYARVFVAYVPAAVGQPPSAAHRPSPPPRPALTAAAPGASPTGLDSCHRWMYQLAASCMRLVTPGNEATASFPAQYYFSTATTYCCGTSTHEWLDMLLQIGRLESEATMRVREASNLILRDLCLLRLLRVAPRSPWHRR